MDIVDDLRDLNSMHTPKEVSDIGEKAADEIERLQKEVMAWWKETELMRSDLAVYSSEIEQLQKNAKQDAKYLLAYHRICQKHGIAPSSSDFLEALKEKE
jgi:hypothetical protein